MASNTQKPKAAPAPKKEAAAKVASPPAKDAPKDVPKDAPKDASKETVKETPKAEGGETAAAAPSDYSRGEGQKPVSAAYRENWNAIFAKKGKKKR
jgi:hypothetical protein